MTNCNLKIIIMHIFNVLLGLITVIFGIIYFDDIIISDFLIRIITIISILLFVNGFNIIKFYEKKIFSPVVVYYIFLYLFSFGQLISFLFGINRTELSAFRYGQYNNSFIFKSVVFSIVSICLFIVGCTISYKIKIISRKKYIPQTGYIKCGLFLCLLSLPLDLYSLFEKFIYSIRYGYAYIYADDFVTNDTFNFIALFIIPGCFLLAWGKKDSKLKYIPCIYLIFRSIVLFIIGTRGVAIATIIAIIWFIMKTDKSIRISKKNIFKICLLTYLVLVISVTLSDFRNESNRDLLLFIQTMVKNLDFIEIANKQLIEMGFSLRPLIEVQKFVNSGIFSTTNGMTFVYSFFLIIPSFLRGNLDILAREKGWIDLSSKLRDSINASYGFGFSLFAEAYYNFKYMGVIYMLFFGILIGWLLSERKGQNYPLVATMLVVLFMTVRSPSQLIIKYIFYFCLIPSCLLYLVGGRDNEKA